MPTIAAAARFENIEKSLNAYINTELVTGLGLTVVFQREMRTESLPDRWIEISFLPLADVSSITRSSSGRHGARSEFLMNANCFEQDQSRLGGSGTTFTLTAITDQVRDVFAPKSSIQVRDYDTAGTPIVGGVKPSGFPTITDVPTPPDAGITQLNVSATLRYIAESID